MLMRSRLYVPGVRPRMIVTAGAFGADIVVLDLEDSVPPDEKDAARDLVREALGIVDFGRSAVFVRVNADEETMGDDLEVLGGPCDGILLPKCDDPLILEYLDDVLAERESELGRERGHFRIIPIIESARGLRQAYEIATATDRVAALTLGLQDLAVDLGMPRSDDEAMLLPRSQVVLASRAAGVPPLDSVHPAIEDEGALFEACVRSRQMGFEGRGAIHPSQVDVIHRAFMPPEAELEWARRVVTAADDASARGVGAVRVDGEMVDAPVVLRARRITEASSAPGPVLDIPTEATDDGPEEGAP